MKKKYIHIYQCKPGDILADDVYDIYGVLIQSKDVIIDKDIIKKLKSIRVRQLSVYELQEVESIIAGGTCPDEFKKSYRENLNIMKQVLGDIEAGRKLDYEKVEHISNSIYSKIGSISNIIECMNEVKSMDEYIYTHSINVSLYALLIAKWLGMPEKEIRNAVTTGILHDIGKAKISKAILNKKGTLLTEEYEQIKNHADIGYQLTKNIPQLTEEIREGIRMHHEREDGKGYPLGKKGDEINLYAKIIALADVYDALTSERAYKRRITPFDTFSELVRIGYGYFDTKILMIFLSEISNYYIGSKVKMNNGETGKVIYVAPQSISTPIVAVNGRYIDLSQNWQFKIAEMM